MYYKTSTNWSFNVFSILLSSPLPSRDTILGFIKLKKLHTLLKVLLLNLFDFCICVLQDHHRPKSCFFQLFSCWHDHNAKEKPRYTIPVFKHLICLNLTYFQMEDDNKKISGGFVVNIYTIICVLHIISKWICTTYKVTLV